MTQEARASRYRQRLLEPARDRQGCDFPCVLSGAAASKTRPRDDWTGWDDITRAQHLSFLANNDICHA